MLNLIKTRRSIRKFTSKAIEDEHLNQIVEAGTWAPSGLNNQPWKIAIIKDHYIKTSVAPLTRYSPIIEGAPVLIAVFLDISLSYDRTKDIQAIGACIQNMLLAIHALGLGGVWLGEILKNKEDVSKALNAPENLELMAVIALGHPAEEGVKKSRKSVEEVVFLNNFLST
jgi:nitroreductase